MTAKGHITLQKYCFYVSWQNLDLNFQPCRLQNSNKTNRRFVRPKRRFGKIKRRLESVQTPFCFFEDFCSNRASGELCFLKVKPWFADCGYGTKKKTIGRIVLPIVFFFVLRCVIRLFCPDILLGLLPSILLRLSSLLL